MSREWAEFIMILPGFRLLEPRRHTNTERIIEKTILQRSMVTTMEYDSFRFSAIFIARRLMAVVISEPMPPEVDITIGVKSAFSTLLIRSMYSLLF